MFTAEIFFRAQFAWPKQGTETMTLPDRSESDQQEDALQASESSAVKRGIYKRVAQMMGLRKHQADLYRSFSRLHPKFKDKWIRMIDRKETTQTIVYCVSKFRVEDQPKAFVFFTNIGSRAAKRWIECRNNPPTIDAIARRITKYLAREFPGVPDSQVVAALEAITETLEQE